MKEQKSWDMAAIERVRSITSCDAHVDLAVDVCDAISISQIIFNEARHLPTSLKFPDVFRSVSAGILEIRKDIAKEEAEAEAVRVSDYWGEARKTP